MVWVYEAVDIRWYMSVGVGRYENLLLGFLYVDFKESRCVWNAK